MWAALLLSLAAPLHAAPLHGAELPPGIRIPPGYDVLSTARFGHASRAWIVVALAQHGETPQMDPAPDRPLLLFERRGGAFVKTGENDTVVLRANEGGQCDPFLDGGGVIAVKGHFFTVQNGVACGNHWTDYITFRFDDASRSAASSSTTSVCSPGPSTATGTRRPKRWCRTGRPGCAGPEGRSRFCSTIGAPRAESYAATTRSFRAMASTSVNPRHAASPPIRNTTP